MAFISKQAALNMMKELDIKFFNILDTDRSVIFRQTDNELSEKAAQEKLEELLESIEGSWVHVQLRTKAGKEIAQGGDNKTGNMDLKVKLTNSGISGPDNNMLNNSQMMQLMHTIADLKAENAAMKQQQKFDKLSMEFDSFKKEMKEKKEEMNPLLAQGVGALINYLNPASKGAEQAAQPINGPTEVDTQTTAGEIIKDSLKRLAKVDSDLHNTLKMLADFAEKKPDQYRSFLPMLKSQL